MLNPKDVEEFVASCQKIINQHYDGYQTLPPTLVVQTGKRYLKIVRRFFKESNGNNFFDESVWAFIDQNGDILKPASWRAPAKHARGNLYDAHKGLKHISWTGPNYLR